MTLFSYLRTTVLGLLAGAAMASSPSQAQYYNQGDATLYSMTNFGGFSKQVSSAIPNLSAADFNNRAASIRTSGSNWLLCQAEQFSGPCLVVRQDVSDLRRFGFRGAVTSIGPLPGNMNFRHGTVVSRNILGEFVFFEADAYGNLNFSHSGADDYRHGNHGKHSRNDNHSGPRNADLIVYSDANHSGQSLGLNASVHSLGELDFNDRVSSVKIRRGDWQFCTDNNYAGRCIILDADEILMSRFRLNNGISSIRRVADGTAKAEREAEQRRLREAAVVMFKEADYQGPYTLINGNTPYLDTDSLNNEVSSIQIRRGKWQFCGKPNYQGDCTILDRSTDGLGAYRMNDKISSVRKLSD